MTKLSMTSLAVALALLGCKQDDASLSGGGQAAKKPPATVAVTASAQPAAGPVSTTPACDPCVEALRAEAKRKAGLEINEATIGIAKDAGNKLCFLSAEFAAGTPSGDDHEALGVPCDCKCQGYPDFSLTGRPATPE